MSSTYKSRILVVDDDEMMRNLLGTILGDSFDVQFAASGREALKLFDDFIRIDLIILDIALGDMTGHEVYDSLRENRVCFGVPVVFLTGSRLPDEEVRAFGSGAVDFIKKPFNDASLMVRIEARLRMSKRLDMAKISELGERFSDKELVLLQLVALSLSNEEIGEIMGYALGTVKQMLNSLLGRLHISSRIEIVKYLM